VRVYRCKEHEGNVAITEDIELVGTRTGSRDVARRVADL
jgi:hypothetical protein